MTSTETHQDIMAAIERHWTFYALQRHPGRSNDRLGSFISELVGIISY